MFYDLDYNRIYRSEFRKVFAFLLAMTDEKELAEELAQETFYRAIVSGKAEFSGRSSIITWLCAIARNLYVDEIKRRGRQTQLQEEMIQEMDPEERTEDADLAQRIWKQVRDLPSMYRQVFELRALYGLSFREIGKRFGKTEGWARVTYHRAKEMINK